MEAIMGDKPWKNWLPGALSKSQLRELCENGDIYGVSDHEKAYGFTDGHWVSFSINFKQSFLSRGRLSQGLRN